MGSLIHTTFVNPIIQNYKDNFEDCLDDIDDSPTIYKGEAYFDPQGDIEAVAPQTQQIVAEEEPISDYYVENEQGGLTPRWIHWADKIASFSESIMGSKLIQTGKAMIGENVGMLVGAAFPESSMAYAAGKAAANKWVGESENKSTIVQGAGVAAALTATALSTSLAYLTGTPMEYSRAVGYMVTTGGIIAGGMNGLETMGQTVPDNYIPRTAAYLVTTGLIGSAVSTVKSIPSLPTPVSTTVAVSGGILKTVSGTAAYYAPETVKLVDKAIHPKSPRSGNLFDPGTFTQEIVKNANGDSAAFSATMAKKFIDSPLIASIAKLLLTRNIDKKLVTNTFIRALNEFAGTIQDKSLQQKIKEYKASPTQQNKDLLQKEINRLIESKYGLIEKGIAGAIRKRSDLLVPDLVKQFTEILSKKEIEFFGIELSDSKQTQNLLELLIPSLIPLIGIYAKRELGSSQDLSTEEIEKFYQNMNAILFAPYNDYILARGVQGLISTAIPVMQNAQFIPAILSETIGQSMVDPIITLDDDEMFNIPALETIKETTKPSQEAKSKKSMRESIRQKIRTIGYLIQFIGLKKFWQTAKTFIGSYFMRKTTASVEVGVRKPKKAPRKTDQAG